MSAVETVLAPPTVRRHGGGLRVDSLDIRAEGRGRSERIVRDLTFDLAPGAALGIVGESGSGKSLTAKAIIGLLPANVLATGIIEFDGKSLLDATEPELRAVRGATIALVMQDPFTMLHPLQRVGATITESLVPEVRRDRERARNEVVRRLAEVGLDPSVAARRTFELSGGMRQRVGIAAALAKDPALLIADEPTTALDASTQSDVLALLGGIQRARGMSLVLITHDLGVAFGVCDRILVMYAGSLMELGAARDLRDDAQHPYTRALMRAAPPITHVLERFDPIPGNVPRPGTVESQCPFAARCEFAVDTCRTVRPEPIAVTPGHGVACLRLDAVRASLRRSDGATLLRVEEPQAAPDVARVSGLTKSYRRNAARPAIDGVSFSIGEGEALGLVGGTGSGKSTIARCMMGLATADSGEIVVGGLDVSDFAGLTIAQRREAYRTEQMVFQDPYASLNPKLSIGAALTEALEIRGGGRTEVPELLERVGLPAEYATRMPHTLSGGERQRVAIARALAIRPRILICDEPVAALDVSVQAQILELLRTTQAEQGMSMLFITHDLAVVRQMTTRLLVCHNGVIVEEGPTERVLDHPEHRYTRQLRAAVDTSRSPEEERLA